MLDKSNIKFVACGIIFDHSFKLLDNWGEIADNLLYKSKYFDYKFFPSISTQYTTERTLTNHDTGNFLKLSSNQLVFRYNIDSTKKFDDEFHIFCQKINEYIVPEILTKNHLRIRKIGVVFCTTLLDADFEKFTNKYFKDSVQGITDFRFAVKGPSKDSLLWKTSNNYINKMYTLGNIFGDSDERGITYDFQLHLNPILPDLREKSDVVLNEALKSFEIDVIKGIG